MLSFCISFHFLCNSFSAHAHHHLVWHLLTCFYYIIDIFPTYFFTVIPFLRQSLCMDICFGLCVSNGCLDFCRLQYVDLNWKFWVYTFVKFERAQKLRLLDRNWSRGQYRTGNLFIKLRTRQTVQHHEHRWLATKPTGELFLRRIVPQISNERWKTKLRDLPTQPQTFGFDSVIRELPFCPVMRLLLLDLLLTETRWDLDDHDL